jgi:hypothetical protein
MATDQKLISHLLDLSRNIEKLSGEVKKSTAATTTLVDTNVDESKKGEKDQSKILEGLKGLDFKGLKDEMSSLTKGFGNLDIKGLSNDIKNLDFKGIGDGLKNLDLKGVGDGLKNLDFKGLTETMKGIDLKGLGDLKNGLGDLKKMDISGVAKNLVSGGGAKDLISGVLGKGAGGILGGFESGGVVKIPGNYIVGEKGREIVNLSKGSSVIPNEMTEPIIKGDPSRILEKAKKSPNPDDAKSPPTADEIGNKIKSILSANPLIGNLNSPAKKSAATDNSDDEVESPYETFTKADIAKLGIPVRHSANKEIDKSNVTTPGTNVIAGNTASGMKKPGFLSRMIGKAKEEIGDGDKMSNLFRRGTNLLESSSGLVGGKLGSPIEIGSNLLKTSNSLGLPKMAMSLASMKKSESGNLPSAVIKNESPTLNVKASPKKQETQQESTTTNKENVISSISEISNAAKGSESPIQVAQNSTGAENVKKDTEESKNTPQIDISEMVEVLTKILDTLNGPLTFSSMDAPFRPDSRRI